MSFESGPVANSSGRACVTVVYWSGDAGVIGGTGIGSTHGCGDSKLATVRQGDDQFVGSVGVGHPKLVGVDAHDGSEREQPGGSAYSNGGSRGNQGTEISSFSG